MSTKIKKRILPTILFSSALPLILFLSTPFDIFAGNYNEFVFSLSNFFWICLAFFAVSTIAIFFILLFLPNKVYRALSGLLLGFAFLMFLQSNFLNSSLTTLGGDGEGSIISTSWMVVDMIIWVVVLAAFVGIALLSDKKGIVSSIGLIVAAVIVASQIIPPVFTAITKRDMFLSFQQRMERMDGDFTHKLLTNKNLTTAASDGNIYIFCVDKMDETWVESIYDKRPDLFAGLTGFTWFQDHISRYGHTYPSIANMLTEMPYSAETATSRVDFLNKAFDSAVSLNTLQSEGWHINIYSEKYYSYNDAFYMPDYVENKSDAKEYKVTNAFQLSKNIVDLGLYRTLPFYIKNLYGRLNSDLFNSSIEEADSEGYKSFRPANDVVDRWTDEMPFSTVEGKGFYFIHTQGLHDAYHEPLRVPAMKQNMDIIMRYINYLKQENLFENSTIIITGDHGNGTPYNKTNLTNSIRTAMFIKPYGVADGELKISKAQTSHTQLWTTILEQAHVGDGADFGTSILETPEGVDQERQFTWHTYNCKLIEYNYTIHGAAKDFSNWELIDKKSFNRKITD